LTPGLVFSLSFSLNTASSWQQRLEKCQYGFHQLRPAHAWVSFWKIIFWQMPFDIFFNTETMHTKSIVHNSVAMISLHKNLTLVGIEPGSAVTQADAMSTAPRRQDGKLLLKLSWRM
jgi:hypothetical protein